MSQTETQQTDRRGLWAALPSVMLGLGLALNLVWLGLLAWGMFELAEWALS